MKKPLKLSKEDFLSWYFDYETQICLGSEIYRHLLKNDKFTIDAIDIFNRLGYLPTSLVNNKKDVCPTTIDEIDNPSENFYPVFL